MRKNSLPGAGFLGLLLLTSLGLLVSFGTPSVASAATVAGLQAQFSDEVEPGLERELMGTLEEIFRQSRRFDWIGFEPTRESISSESRDCFTEECLKSAGESLDAPLGLRLRFDVETEIFQWTITFYDLTEGQPILTEVGTCELCGRAEVLQQFRASIQAPLATLRPAERVGQEPLRADQRGIPEGHTRLRISVVPEDTRIFVDERPVGEGSGEIDLAEGTYEVRFSHDTHRGLRETIIISQTSPEVIFMRIHLSRPSGFQETTLMTRGDGFVDHIEPNRNVIGATMLGAGAAVVVTGHIVGGLHGRSTCPGDTPINRCEELYNTAGISTGLTVLGATSMAAGAVLLVWPLLAGTFREDSEGPEGISIRPSLGLDYAGLSITRQFR